jgi:hypothetical protein
MVQSPLEPVKTGHHFFKVEFEVNYYEYYFIVGDVAIK